jgi:sugar O-acyltransferase (sialic acid O-acetyltransferase NeuD family)
MGEKVVIFGVSEMAKLCHFYLTHDSSYEVVAFSVNHSFIAEQTLFGLPVVSFENIESIYPPDECKMFVAIQYSRLNRNRAEKYLEAKLKGYELINYVSSRAATWPGLVIGDNCFIGENSSIGPFVKIGNSVLISPGTVVGHDTKIGDYCFLASHTVILGSVTIEPYCFLGANSTIKDGITIRRGCILGAGSYISENTREKGVYINKPAELMLKSSDEWSRLLTWGAELRRTKINKL